MIKDIRIGNGIDVHRFVEGRKLILGGVEIPHTHGLLGHSDADALLHAISDALLGALALGDIGKYFPDDDMKFKDADSKQFLLEINKLVADKGFKIQNIDTTLLLQKPKISPYVDKMKEVIANLLQLEKDRISIKATTTEKLGYIGREEGVIAEATVLLVKF